ncbi:MAG: PDZ domain-containing protein, partial [Planctomycetes bacterium]|nr:PDZ domain-containing protein [Planctomycetota bacterium]
PSHLQMAQAIEAVMVDAIAKAEKSVVAIARVRKGARNVAAAGDFRDGLLGERLPGERLPGERLPGERLPGMGLPGDGLPLVRPSFGLLDTVPTSPDFVPNEFATGVVIDRQGHVVTNYHVLGNPEENDYFVWVRRKPFEVVEVEVPEHVEAGDPWTDLAVLKIAAENLEPIVFGDVTRLRKGMVVIALGNPFGIARDGEVSASWGIVSNLRRAAPPPAETLRSDAERDSLHQFGTLIQTDARLELGASGGALVDLKGEMIGLTTALTALTGYEHPAGFAIPVDDAFRKTMETLKQGRLPAFGFLGVQPEHLSLAERQQGAFGTRVLRIVPGSPADLAGVRQGDIITHVNGERVEDRNVLFRELSKMPADSLVTIVMDRRDPLRPQRRNVTVEARLTKKYVESARKPYARLKEPVWRGLTVEYPSALPPQFHTLGFQAIDRQGCVAVFDVDKESPAWKAGLRRGEYISHVGDRRVSTPREFHAAVEGMPGDVRLQLTASRGEAVVRVISADES